MSHFWKEKTLAQMTKEEWESLCDGCGKCCLHKIIDDATEELHFTNVACKLLHTKSCQCRHYEQRFKYVKSCVKVSLDDIEQFHWLPKNCAYLLLIKGQPLPHWHPLLTGNQSAMHKGGFSIRGKTVSETEINIHYLDEYIATWPAL
ncbi:YcgN family cysteine cluster protein [Psychromonas sp. CD1]|uniref:YcgN family cysteine cluster protein n=1 Tax=Psychromonas sp. CD1 TaxID=1979839 RepID=UPI000B9A59AD|nr:YcgN family cysteine cluster protein [Psychromonas sp. CD1]